MISLPTTETEFRNALVDAAEVGAQKALINVGVLSATIKLADAYRLYGRRQVDAWIEARLIDPIKDGSRNCSVRIDRVQITGVAMTANRKAFFSK